mgnify:CR=1 FL=1
MDERDCMFPDCLVREVYGCACEHSCPFEREKYKERADRARPKPYSQDCLASEVPGGACQSPDCGC